VDLKDISIYSFSPLYPLDTSRAIEAKSNSLKKWPLVTVYRHRLLSFGGAGQVEVAPCEKGVADVMVIHMKSSEIDNKYCDKT